VPAFASGSGHIVPLCRGDASQLGSGAKLTFWRSASKVGARNSRTFSRCPHRRSVRAIAVSTSPISKLRVADDVVGFNIDNASRLGALLRDFIASGATIEDLARAWASLEGKREEFDQENCRGASGACPRYLAEIEEILQRAAKSARGRGSSSISPANH
jgi:hypothetical protein